MRSGLAAFGVSFAILLLAAAPSLHALDSAELAAAGVRLGLSHPPGQATHAILVHLATWLPLGDLGFRANLVSVLGAALAAGLLAAGAERLGARLTVACAIGTAVALSGPCVEHATRTEVYTPALATVALALLLGHAVPRRDGRAAAGAGLAAGLAASLHPAAGIALVLAHLSEGLRQVRSHVRFALGAAAGALPMAWVVIRGPHDAQSLWDAPRDLGEALRYWTGAGFGKNFTSTHLPTGMAEAAWIVGRGCGGVLLVAAVVAVARLRDRRGAALLVAALLSLVPMAPLPFLLENPDLAGYALPALAIVALVAARGAAPLPAGLGRALAAAVVVATVALGGGVRGLRPRSRLVEARVEEGLEVLPPRAVLVAESDLTVGALSFLQTARGERPDVAWLGSGVAGQRAPWVRIRRQDPALAPLPRLAPVPGDPRDRAVVALLALAHARLPCFVEDRRFLREGREWAGWAHLGAGDPAARLHWARIRREARGDGTAEAALRSSVGRIAAILADQSEPRTAGRALLVGLPRVPAALRRVVDALPARASLRPSVPDGVLHDRFSPDEEWIERAIARLAFRAGRPADAVRTLQRARRNGSDEAAAQLALFAIADGRADEARAIVRALVEQSPGLDEPLARLLDSIEPPAP